MLYIRMVVTCYVLVNQFFGNRCSSKYIFNMHCMSTLTNMTCPVLHSLTVVDPLASLAETETRTIPFSSLMCYAEQCGVVHCIQLNCRNGSN